MSTCLQVKVIQQNRVFGVQPFIPNRENAMGRINSDCEIERANPFLIYC